MRFFRYAGLICLCMFLLQFVNLAFAQDLTELPKTSGEQKAQMDSSGRFKMKFDDELVKGSVDKPDLVNLATKPHVKFKKLIKIRDDFSDEMNNARSDFSEKN